ncbi:MAG: hypothetical protein JWQ81_2305 [Amycolatopsis sp.]|uniref:GNAT family N-acetyltransferase n=1 Tax=Amycolatopsis sp. TaxID=37632 RepID=UPI0026326A92|nr:GNAT family N-acetyltransferase [Amycolatopsis sp.]MCU1681566.1 hypothetical protein [Amycolatopsis sp.]
MPNTLASIQSYIRDTAADGRELERIGPFLATFSRNSTNPFLNYAIPDTGARPSRSDVDGLIAAYRQRALLPRLEFLTESAPDVEAVLVNAGFDLERRVPLMVCPPGSVVAQPRLDGIELLVPKSDAEFEGMSNAQNEAFGEPGGITAAGIEHAREQLELGGLATLARDGETGEPAGGGVGTPLRYGITELAGIGVREQYRQRGIGAAITEFLAHEAYARGGRTVFLTPGGIPEERLYARVGFVPAGECVHLRLTS